MENNFKCCICKKTFTGYGNNPEPVSTKKNARCCNKCNEEVVLPARFDEIMRRRSSGTEQS